MFFQKEKYGYTLNFASNRSTESSMENHIWYAMQLKEDFHKKLTEFGRLPIINLDKKFNMIKENKDLKEEIEKLRE